MTMPTTQEELRTSEIRYRRLFEAARDGILILNAITLKITDVNPFMTELLGYSRDGFLGKELWEIGLFSDKEASQAAFRELQKTSYLRYDDLPLQTRHGESRQVEFVSNVYEEDGDQVIQCNIRDITEQKRLEVTRQAIEGRYRTLFEQAPDGIVIADRESYYIDANASICRMLGYTRDELIGLHASDIVAPAETEHIQEALTVIKAKSDYYREWQFRRKNGSQFAGEVIATMMPDGNLLAMIRDITERKQVEEKLRKSQEQLAGVIGSAMDAIITIDDQQQIVLFNNAAERMFLSPSEDAIGKPIDHFIPKRFHSAHRLHIEEFGRTLVSERTVGSLGAIFGLRADGQEFPIEASISQLESEGRKLYTVILRDITERKRSEEALKEQARILDLAPVLIRDLGGRILFWNTGAEQLYGWTSAEALGKLKHSLLRTEFPIPLEEIKASLFAHGHWEGELVHSKKNGERIVVLSHWVVHKNDQDEPKAILEVNNDITERREAEKEILRLNEELEQRVADRTAQLQAANKELETFSYSVSHDLRAPLRHINGFSQALLEDYADQLDETGKGYLQEVRGASQEMGQLIDDMLQLARVTRSEMHPEVVNLSELAHSIVTEMQKADVGRTVAVDIEEGLSISGDKRLLRIMLSNLVGNAWKFTSKREHAEITFGQTHTAELVYFVRDNGAGFDMAYVDKLFAPFQRLHGAGEFEGTGIGLATVQRIVRRHGGRVWTEGAVDQGATFYFTLANFKEAGNGEQSDLTG